MTKTLIVCIVGESGSGKTYASQYLQKRFGLHAIVSYTTRPIREEETDGVEHFFVNKEQVPSKDRMMAYTEFGGYQYWTEKEQFFDSLTCSYVIDEKGLQELRQIVPPQLFHIMSVKIKRTNKAGISAERIARDKEREEIADKLFDAVVDNDGTLVDFEYKLGILYEKIWQIQSTL